jgi:hypothetical protein
MEPVEPDEPATAVMDEEVTATKTAVEGVTAERAADMAEAMTTTVTTSAVATTMPATAAGIGDLGQADDHRDQQGKHQAEQLTTHDTLLWQTVPPINRRH